MTSFWTFLSVIVVTSSCGRIDRSPHYSDEKKFGRGNQTLGPSGVGGDAEQEIAIELPPTEAGAASSNGNAQTETPLNGASTSSEGPSLEAEPELPEIQPEIRIDPNTVVVSVSYRGLLDRHSLRLLTSSGSSINPWDYSVSRSLLGRYQPKADIKFFSAQTYGDDTSGVSTVTQHGISNSGDVGVMLGDESESGTQILERVVGDKRCPAPLICIRSMQWKPQQGEDKTYCYRDQESRKLTAFPYSPAPNFSMQDMQAAEGSLGPYNVERYRGIVDCQNLGRRRPESIQSVYVRIQVKEDPKFSYKIQTSGKIAADYSVRMLIDKASGKTPVNVQPYVDQSTRLQAEAEYFINSKAKTLVKIIKRVRKSVEFAGDQSWIGSVIRGINYVSPIDGISADVHIEYCQNLMKVEQPSFCPNSQVGQ